MKLTILFVSLLFFSSLLVFYFISLTGFPPPSSTLLAAGNGRYKSWWLCESCECGREFSPQRRTVKTPVKRIRESFTLILFKGGGLELVVVGSLDSLRFFYCLACCIHTTTTLRRQGSSRWLPATQYFSGEPLLLETDQRVISWIFSLVTR